MASIAATPAPANKSKAKKYDEWEVRDAMYTMMRAGEIVKDKKLLGLVRKEAAEHSQKMKNVAQQASQLAKMGRISPRAMAKLAG